MNQKNLMEITSLDHGHLSGCVGGIDGDVLALASLYAATDWRQARVVSCSDRQHTVLVLQRGRDRHHTVLEREDRHHTVLVLQRGRTDTTQY